MKNYTTKPIELPLSTEKEYVLVDVKGYKKAYTLNEFIMNECNLTEPFKFDVVCVDGVKGFIDKIRNTSVVSDRYEEHKYFHEVIRQPESEDEWNGEGLPPVGTVCECSYPNDSWNMVKYLGTDFQGLHVIAYGGGAIEQLGSLVKFRKPETTQQRKDRERLEIISQIQSDMNYSGSDYSAAERLYDAGYRKEQN